jgi:iron complex outermembrane receptor protein
MSVVFIANVICRIGFIAAVGLYQGYSQSYIQISGIVTDSATNEPLPGVTVIANQREAITGTDSLGRYQLKLRKRKENRYLLQFSFIGYRPEQLLVTLSRENIENQNIKLSDRDFVTEEVVVSGAKFEQKIEELSVSMTTLKPRRFDMQAQYDPQQTLQQQSGITIYDRQVSIRGSSGYTYGAGSRVMVLLDGLPMINPDRGSVAFEALPIDNLAQVEVIKGAASVLYGAGAMGGIINVLTASPGLKPQTGIRIRGQGYDRTANDSIINRPFRQSAGGSIHISHSRRIGQHIDLIAGLDAIHDGGYRQDEFYRRLRAGLRATYRVPRIPGLEIGLNFQTTLDTNGAIVFWRNYPAGALQAGADFQSYQFLTRYTIDPSISYLTAAGHRHIYRGRYFYNRNDIVPGTQDGTAILHYHEYQYVRPLKKWGTCVVGLNYQRNIVLADSVFGQAVGEQYAAFAQLELKAGSRLNVSLGCRYQYEQMAGSNVIIIPDPLNPTRTLANRLQKENKVTMNTPVFRGGINYRAAIGTFLRASIGQAVRSPSVAERYAATQAGAINIIPNPEIELEKGYSAEIAARQLIAIGKISGFMDVAAFQMNFQNMVEFYADNQSLTRDRRLAFSAQNVSGAQINGIEFNTLFTAKWSKLEIDFGGGVVYTDPRDKNGNPYWETDQGIDSFKVLALQALLGLLPPDQFPKDLPPTLKYRNKWLVRAFADVRYKQWSLGINHRYNSPIINIDKIFLVDFPGALSLFPGTLEFRRRHPRGWHIVDLVVGFTPVKTHTISFHIFNLLNTEYMTIPGLMGAPRSFALQYRLQL